MATGLVANLLVQATGTLIPANQTYSNFITVTTANNACLLPAGPLPSGTQFTIRNSGASGLQVFPNVGSAINGLAINLPYVIPVGQQANFVVASDSTLGAGCLRFLTMAESALAKTQLVDAGATRTLTASESGSVFSVSAAAARVYTLPAVAAGLNYKFMITTAGANTVGITAAGLLNGAANLGAAGAVTCVVAAASNTLQFAAAAPLGSWASVTCDGTVWHIAGQCCMAAGFTLP